MRRRSGDWGGLWYNLGTMTTIRTFIAIELSDAARTALAGLQNRLKTISPPHSVRWTAVQNIHLTLHFLGDTPAENIDAIGQVLQAAAETVPPFEVNLGRLGCFPNTRRPRVLWAGLMDTPPALPELHRRLGAQLAQEIGFAPETRPYAPHLTLGRVKNGIPARHLRQLSQAIEQAQPGVGKLATLHVAEIRLIKSQLKPTGAIYSPLHTARLGG